MLPVKRPSHNFTYKGPTPEIGDLSCERRDGVVFSHWRPHPDELEILNADGVIELGIFTEPIPPVSLNVPGADTSTNDPGRLCPEEVEVITAARLVVAMPGAVAMPGWSSDTLMRLTRAVEALNVLESF